MAPPSDFPTTTPITVLHVDDDESFRELVVKFLRRTDEAIRVVSVGDVADGVERLRTDDIDCVLSDYEMPEMDGLDFLSRVRAFSTRLPFILYTSQGDEEVAKTAISKGVDDYIQKRPSAAHYLKLVARIRNEVRRARAEREREKQLAALEAASEGICVLDDGGRVSYANQAYLDLYGYEREELLGKSWEVLHPESEVEFMTSEVLPRVEREGEWNGESSGQEVDGTEFRESKSVATVPGGGLVIVATAVTQSTSASD